MTPSRKTLVSRLTATVSVAALVAATMGCTPSDQKANPDAMNAIAADIQHALAARPDVTNAEVTYQDSFDAPGLAAVDVKVTPAGDLHTVSDEAVRLVWRSTLNPLRSIRVDVTDAQNPKRSMTETVNPAQPDDKARLDTKYGPHPK